MPGPSLLCDPVTIPCGHSYCMGCIKGSLSQEDEKGVYSCPQCRQTFSTKPALNKSNVLSELVQQVRKTRSEVTRHAGEAQAVVLPGDVECDLCSGEKLKAVKSCLDCVLSYCEAHFEFHNMAHPGKKHSVVNATFQLQERVCSRHEKVLEIFCRTDQTCICYLCMIDAHKGHDTITAATEWTHKSNILGETQRRFRQRGLEREKELQELKEAMENLKTSAQTAVEDSERVFTKIIHSMERRHSEVTELIRAQEKAQLSQAEGLLEKHLQEIDELKGRDAALGQLSQTQDPIHFLKNISPFKNLPQTKIETIDIFSADSASFEAVKESVCVLEVQLEEKLDEIFKQEKVKISTAVEKMQIIHSVIYTDHEQPMRRTGSMEGLPPNKGKKRKAKPRSSACSRQYFSADVTVAADQVALPQPVTRDDFLQYFCPFTLDPNTAHTYLLLSEGNKKVECRHDLQSYPDHPDRFVEYAQVLCREGLCGRSYWEVEWSTGAAIAVSYKSISRKGWGDNCVFGCNDQSWRLDLSDEDGFSFWGNNQHTALHLAVGSKVGVYVDHRAGILAFYNVSDTMTLLHRVHTTFTHTLYPGFRFNIYEPYSWCSHQLGSLKLV